MDLVGWGSEFTPNALISWSVCGLVDMQMQLVSLSSGCMARAPASFKLLLEVPLTLLVCRSERRPSKSATSSSWVCATNGHLGPNLMKRVHIYCKGMHLSGNIRQRHCEVAWCPEDSPFHFQSANLWDFFVPTERIMDFFIFPTDLRFRLCLGCWTVSRVMQAWKTSIVIHLSQGVIVGIQSLTHQRHMKHLWLAGSDGLASILISRAELVRSYCFKVWWLEENFWSNCTCCQNKNLTWHTTIAH